MRVRLMLAAAVLCAACAHAQVVVASTPADDIGSAARVFGRTHPDLLLGGNLALMQVAIRDVARDDLPVEQILERAYRLAQANPAWVREAQTGSITWDDAPTATPPGHQCVSSNGIVYYTTSPCWTPAIGQENAVAAMRQSAPAAIGIRTQPRPPQRATVRTAIAWQQDQVQGLPGAVMVGPDQALNPYNGHIVQLETAVPGQPNQPRVISAGGSAEADIACDQARRAGWSGQERSNCSMGLGPDGQP